MKGSYHNEKLRCMEMRLRRVVCGGGKRVMCLTGVYSITGHSPTEKGGGGLDCAVPDCVDAVLMKREREHVS